MDKISKVGTFKEGGVHSIVLKKTRISCLVISTSLVQHITPSFKNLICNELKYSYQAFRLNILHRLPLSTLGEAALLFIIFTTFCDALKTHDVGMNASDILITVALVLFLQMALLYISFHVAELFYIPNDVITITFCATHKSLTLGVPILRILFAGYAHFSQITLPLLVYHPTQIILGGLLVPILKKWLHRQGGLLP